MMELPYINGGAFVLLLLLAWSLFKLLVSDGEE